MTETCETCRFFAKDRSYPWREGTCERIHCGGGNRNMQARIVGDGHLRVGPDFSCGEHSPKEPR